MIVQYREWITVEREVPDEEVLIGWRCDCGSLTLDEEMGHDYLRCRGCHTPSPHRIEVAVIRDKGRLIEVTVPLDVTPF